MPAGRLEISEKMKPGYRLPISSRHSPAEIAEAFSTFSSKAASPLCFPLSVTVRTERKGIRFT